MKNVLAKVVLLCCMASMSTPTFAAQTIFFAPPGSQVDCQGARCDITVYVISMIPFYRYDSSGKPGPQYFCQTFVDYETTTTKAKTKIIKWTLKQAQLGDKGFVYQFDDDSVTPPIDLIDPSSPAPSRPYKPKKFEKPGYDDPRVRQGYMWNIKGDNTSKEVVNYQIRVNRYEKGKDGSLTLVGPCEPNDPVIDNQS